MAYSYYQNAAPTWGTQQYQITSPPMPSYQPQPSWTGQDYYRAHAGVNDISVFDYAWNKVKNFMGGGGIGMAEAQLWHRKIYYGLSDIRQMLPSDIGAAAAYESWRSWRHHHGVIAQPLSGDRERQREALIGLAVAEATRLYGYTGRIADTTGRLQASEMAATTASRIFNETIGSNSYDYGGGGYGAPMLGRSTSSNSLRSQYAYDDPAMYGGTPMGGRIRRNSFNTMNGPGMISASPTGYGGGMPLPPSPTMMAANPAYGSYGQAGLYGQPSYSGQVGGYMGGLGQPSAYGGQYPNQGISQTSMYGQPGYAGSYGGGGYGGQYPGQSVGLPVPPGGTVVIQTPSSSSRSHRHHHHRRHSGRSVVEYGIPGTAYSAGY